MKCPLPFPTILQTPFKSSSPLGKLEYYYRLLRFIPSLNSICTCCLWYTGSTVSHIFLLFQLFVSHNWTTEYVSKTDVDIERNLSVLGFFISQNKKLILWGLRSTIPNTVRDTHGTSIHLWPSSQKSTKSSQCTQ